jgi:hypothetical protein
MGETGGKEEELQHEKKHQALALGILVPTINREIERGPGADSKQSLPGKLNYNL